MRGTVLLLLLAMSMSPGCGSAPVAPPPATFAVTGKVIGRDGQPLTGGIVQFVSKTQPGLNMSSSIAADGTFKLQTLHENGNLAGAIEGPCEVLVTLPFQEGQIPEVIVLKETLTINAKDNHFEIKLTP